MTTEEIKADLDDMASLLEWVHAHVPAQDFDLIAASLQKFGFKGKLLEALPRMKALLSSETAVKIVALLKNTEERPVILWWLASRLS